MPARSEPQNDNPRLLQFIRSFSSGGPLRPSSFQEWYLDRASSSTKDISLHS